MTTTTSLTAMKKALDRYDAALREARISRDRADDAILKALESGATFRDVATRAGRSVSWVQSVVRRNGVDIKEAKATKKRPAKAAKAPAKKPAAAKTNGTAPAAEPKRRRKAPAAASA
jgi:hypothetical protein